MTTRDVKLEPQIRGTPFRYTTALEGGWTFGQFSKLFFALRRRVPSSQVVGDGDAIGRASSDAGSITGSGTTVTVTIPPARTRFWPVEELVWELRGVIDGEPQTIAMGSVQIVGDVSRSS